MVYLSTDSTNGLIHVQNWLDYNAIPWQGCVLWDHATGLYTLPEHVESSVLVCNSDLLTNRLQVRSKMLNFLGDLENFFAKNNRIWFVGTDLALDLMQPRMLELVKVMDAVVPAHGVTFFLDANMTDRCAMHKLTNARLVCLTRNLFNQTMPRIQCSSSLKLHPRYDFLLTMVRKRSRPHRDILWQQLQDRPRLLERGLSNYHARTSVSDVWIGRTAHQHEWHDGHASMDLYLDCWLEIVPETCYRDLYFFTEKTQKPIMTQTPFLMVSTAGYLDWLRQQGFRTFDALIDEAYDRHHRVEDRIAGMLDVLEHIVSNGTEAFYHASGAILEHNFSRLCEISGSWWSEFDRTMWRALEDFTKQQKW